MPVPTLAEALAAVRTTTEALAQRPDVVFLHRRFGEPAAAELLLQFAEGSNALPAELLELYGLVNGLWLEWQWIGGDGGGHLHLPPLRPGSFTTKSDTYRHPAHGQLLRLLLTPEVAIDGTYLAADEPGNPLYQHSGRWPTETYRLAGSVAEVLSRSAAAYFAPEWRYDIQYRQELLARLARPAALLPIPGARVWFSSNWLITRRLHYRGVVQELTDLPAASPLRAATRLPTYALLQLDATRQLAWVPVEELHPVPDDVYEYFWADPQRLLTLGQTQGWEVALRRMALAWGPMMGITDFYTKHWELPAALLGQLPLVNAFDLIQQVVAAVEAAIPNFADHGFCLTEEEQALAANPGDWPTYQWCNHWDAPLEVLLAGLLCRVYFADPAERRTIRPLTIKKLQAVRRPSVSWWASNELFYRYLKRLRDNKPIGMGTPGVLGLAASCPDLPGNQPYFCQSPPTLAQRRKRFEDAAWDGC